MGQMAGQPKPHGMPSSAMELMEESGAIWDSELSDLAGLFQGTFMAIPGLLSAGCTDEIMSNIIAERVLGLPQEPRMYKGIPFNEVPTSE